MTASPNIPDMSLQAVERLREAAIVRAALNAAEAVTLSDPKVARQGLRNLPARIAPAFAALERLEATPSLHPEGEGRRRRDPHTKVGWLTNGDGPTVTEGAVPDDGVAGLGKAFAGGLVTVAKNPRRWVATPLGIAVRAALLAKKGEDR